MVRHVKEGDNIYVIQDIYGVEEKIHLSGQRRQNAEATYNALKEEIYTKEDVKKDLIAKKEALEEDIVSIEDSISDIEDEQEDLVSRVDKFNGVFDKEEPAQE